MLEAREGTLKTEEGELEAFEKDAKLTETSAPKVLTSDLLDDEGIAANCVLFILAGFDTTQSLLLFSTYALAVNPDVQERLREEINSVLEETGGKFTYDGLSKMVYLDMVIQGKFQVFKISFKICNNEKFVTFLETLRMWSPAVATDRQCISDYSIPGTDLVIKKGEAVSIPIMGFHYDEKFYPNPQKFDPERFSPENKSKINPYAYLPFGQGPRNCIGRKIFILFVKDKRILFKFWFPYRHEICIGRSQSGTFLPRHTIYN